MHRVLTLMLMTAIYLYAQYFQSDRFITETVHNRLKFALNRAAHDAALQVDRRQLADGRIVFARADARAAFEASLRGNLQLADNLVPAAGTLLKEAPQIVFEDYVDDASIESFPITYLRPDQQMIQVLKGPSVVFRIRVKLPRTNAFSYDGYVYKNVVYEYPL